MLVEGFFFSHALFTHYQFLVEVTILSEQNLFLYLQLYFSVSLTALRKQEPQWHTGLGAQLSREVTSIIYSRYS